MIHSLLTGESSNEMDQVFVNDAASLQAPGERP